MNLYELTSNYLYLQQLIEDPEIDAQVIADTMEAIEGSIEEKADGYAKVIRNMEASISAIKAEQERLAARKNLLELGIKRLKANLEASMIATGKRKFKTDLFSFSIQKNGGKAPVILDVPVEELPDDYVVITEKPDLTAIGTYLETHSDCEFAHFGDRGEGLRIK